MSITRTTNGSASILNFKTPKLEASLSLYGGHFLTWKPTNQDDVFYLSPTAIYKEGKAIRGGIPICWPWFGPVDQPQHGYARISNWKEEKAEVLPDGSVHVSLSLEIPKPEMKAVVDFKLDDTTFEQSLKTINGSQPYDLTGALHAYFAIDDIEKIHITGLEDVKFIEKSSKPEKHSESPLRIFGEIDRVYCPTTGPIELHDESKKRTIKIERSGSKSAVVWNIWENAKNFGDMPANDYRKYVCIEAANAADDQVHLEPNQEHVLLLKATILK